MFLSIPKLVGTSLGTFLPPEAAELLTARRPAVYLLHQKKLHDTIHHDDIFSTGDGESLLERLPDEATRRIGCINICACN